MHLKIYIWNQDYLDDFDLYLIHPTRTTSRFMQFDNYCNGQYAQPALDYKLQFTITNNRVVFHSKGIQSIGTQMCDVKQRYGRDGKSLVAPLIISLY